MVIVGLEPTIHDAARADAAKEGFRMPSIVMAAPGGADAEKMACLRTIVLSSAMGSRHKAENDDPDY